MSDQRLAEIARDYKAEENEAFRKLVEASKPPTEWRYKKPDPKGWSLQKVAAD